MTISVEAGRVLGCLMEKRLTTPQQYPLTANALASACNQTTNRQPVMSLDELTVGVALDELKADGLVRFVLPSHGKSVTRYRHVADDLYGLDERRSALLAVLLLRGPQTPGELRGRAERMATFDSVADVNLDLEALAGQPEPLVQLLGRQPGQKEERWRQLLASESSAAGPAGDTDEATRWAPGVDASSSARRETPSDGIDPNDLGQRIGAVESRLATLEHVVSSLSDSLEWLRRNLGDDETDRDEPVDPA